MTRTIAFVWALVAASGCQRVVERIDFERMIDQHKLEPYELCRVCNDAVGMRMPPQGTVPRQRNVDLDPSSSGLEAGEAIAKIPLPMTDSLLRTGKARYEIYCSPCHGILGFADTIVAARAQLRKPPSLHEPRIAALRPGHVFRVIGQGYGLMPSYADVLAPAERWGVVAYLDALRRSQDLAFDELSPALRAEFEEAVR